MRKGHFTKKVKCPIIYLQQQESIRLLVNNKSLTSGVLGYMDLLKERSEEMLEVKNLVKTFGNYTAVDRVSFQIPDGKIMGLIGQNGAGKTTTFRFDLGFFDTRPRRSVMEWSSSWGEKIMISSVIFQKNEDFYPKVTIQDQLLYFAELRGKSRKKLNQKSIFWMEKFQVKGKKTDKVKSLSKGNQQKSSSSPH